MAISKDKKQQLVADLNEILSDAKMTVFAKYQGLSVSELQELRHLARENNVKIKVVKNKVAPPFKTATVNMIYGEGISHTDEIITLAVDNDIIDKSGAWFSYNGEKIGQGINSVREYMKTHPEFDAEITQRVKEALMPETVTQEEA